MAETNSSGEPSAIGACCRTKYPRRVLALVIWLASVTCHGAEFADIQRLLDTGDAAAAYAAALAMSDEHSGDAEFDLLFGLAALDSGHIGEAILALERVVVLQPTHLRARLELARAYYAVGEWDNARAQFDLVLRQDPPPNVQERIRAYLQAIDNAVRSLVWRSTASASLAAGYDNNINSATPDSSVEVPALGTVALADGSRKFGSSFVTATVSGDTQYRMSKRTAVTAGANAQWRNNTSSDGYDTLAGGLQIASVFSGANYSVAVPVQLHQLAVNDQTWRRMWAVGLEYNRAYGARQVGVSGQLGRLAYPDDYTRDAELSLLGAHLAWATASKMNWSISVFYGDEDVRADSAPQYGRRYGGTNVALLHSMSAVWAVTGNVGWQTARYAANDPVFGVTRDEQLSSAALGLRHQWNRQASAQLRIDWWHNDANVSLYEYDRSQVSGVIAYEF